MKRRIKKCPVCGYYQKITPNGNILNHIKAKARAELLKWDLFHWGTLPHRDYILKNGTVISNELCIMKVEGHGLIKLKP